jgi:hypothetical protein
MKQKGSLKRKKIEQKIDFDQTNQQKEGKDPN